MCFSLEHAGVRGFPHYSVSIVDYGGVPSKPLSRELSGLWGTRDRFSAAMRRGKTPSASGDPGRERRAVADSLRPSRYGHRNPLSIGR